MKRLIYNTQYIDAYMQRKNLTKEEFAKLCNLTIKELNNFYAQINMSILKAFQIIDVLHITTDTFLFMENNVFKKQPKISNEKSSCL